MRFDYTTGPLRKHGVISVSHRIFNHRNRLNVANIVFQVLDHSQNNRIFNARAIV